MSEQKLKLGYRMFYASVWDIRDQKHSVAILCGPNGEGCFASPLNPAKAFEPGATGSQWGVTGHDATDKFLTDLSAFEAKSRKSEIVAGPGPEPSQAKQDAKDLRRIASYSPDDDPDKTVMLAIADRLDAAACEAGMVGMGFTPTTDAADAEPGWILRKENERLRKELKSALACARSWHATVQETEKILERTADERNAAKADLAAVRRTLQTIGSLPADLQNLTVKLEAVEAENERLRKQLAERTDLHHAAREGKDTYKKRAVSAEARLKELESKAPAMAADVMQQLKASEAELARLRPVVDAACEWAKARMEYSAFNNTPERRAAIESSGQRLYVAVADMQSGQPQEPQTETPALSKPATDDELRAIVAQAAPPAAPWLTHEEREAIGTTMLCDPDYSRRNIIAGMLRRTSDAKPPECPITDEDVFDLSAIRKLHSPTSFAAINLTRIHAHCRQARGEKEADHETQG